MFLAARPTICMRAVSLRRKPWLSADMTATSDTWGKSMPSLIRLTPTKQSIVLFWSDFKASARSTVLRSEWMYAALAPFCDEKAMIGVGVSGE